MATYKIPKYNRKKNKNAIRIVCKRVQDPILRQTTINPNITHQNIFLKKQTKTNKQNQKKQNKTKKTKTKKNKTKQNKKNKKKQKVIVA